MPKIIKIGQCFTQLFKEITLAGTVCFSGHAVHAGR